jgi:peptidoglycan/LPS O-acetylase OafA/YrhL
MFAADVLTKSRSAPIFTPRGRALIHAACVVALAGFVYLGGVFNDPGPYYDYPRDLIPAAVLALLILVTTELSPRGLWPYDNPVSRFLGDVSYGVFLFHMIVLQLAWRLLKLPSFGVEKGSWLLYAVVIPVSVLVAFASHRGLELPVLRFVRREQQRAASASRAP